MSELILNDETKRVRAPLQAPESLVAQELRLPNFQSTQGRFDHDGFLVLPTLNDWREAEREARQRLAAGKPEELANKHSS